MDDGTRGRCNHEVRGERDLVGQTAPAEAYRDDPFKGRDPWHASIAPFIDILPCVRPRLRLNNQSINFIPDPLHTRLLLGVTTEKETSH